MDRWRRAFAELRAHPARFGATALAITLAVAFLVGTQVFLATERAAVTAREALFASRADIVVETYLWRGGFADYRRDEALDIAELLAGEHPDVVTTAQFSQVYSQAQAGERVVGLEISSIPSEELQWMEPTEGRLPAELQEIALARDAAARLGIGVGDEIRLNSAFLEPFTVVGITRERGFTDPPAYVTMESLVNVGASLPPPDHMLLVDPASTRRTTPGSSGDGLGVRLLVKTQPGKAQAVKDALAQQLYDEGVMRIYAQVRTVEEIRALEAEARRGVPDPLGALVTAGAALALLTGSLIVAVTFGVLATQRRRQVGLLRAVGATRGQALAQLLAEALLIGLGAACLGGVLGVAGAAAGAAVTTSLDYGFVLPWGRVVLGVLAGIVVTLLAAAGPLARAARLSPLAALADLPGGPSRRRGIVLANLAPRRWPTLRLSLASIERTPVRALLTVASLALAVALIVAVQVALETGRRAAFAQVDERYPVDVTIVASLPEPDVNPNGNGVGPDGIRDSEGWLKGFAPGSLQKVRDTPGVEDVVGLRTGQPVLVALAGQRFRFVSLTPAGPAVDALLARPLPVEEGTLCVSDSFLSGSQAEPGDRAQIVMMSVAETRPLDVVLARCNLSEAIGLVHPDDYVRVPTQERDGMMLVRLDDPDGSAEVASRLQSILMEENPGLTLGGGAQEKEGIRMLLAQLAAVALGLLAMTAVVALIGVSNLLGLSVLERRREIGLLRALGTSQGAVRRMLLAESVLLGVVAVVVGLGLGVLGGRLLGTAAARHLALPQAATALPWGPVAVTVGVVLIAGLLASVLPGRSAARIPPVEALADLG